MGTCTALVAVYLLVLAGAALFYRADGRPRRASSRLAIVIPAHNEAGVIRRCVESLQAQTFDRGLYEIVVIADNCTDDTAAVAASAGATVLLRDVPDARGKGRALQWAFERVLAGESAPDAVIVVDADSFADPAFVASLAGRLEAGATCVQGESLLSNEGPPAAALRAAAFLLINRTRPAGRTALKLPGLLAGNGMLFGRELLREHPWSAFSSTEDVEYGVDLRLAGINPVFAGGAVLWSLPAPNPAAASQQQLRWEGGKLHVARTRIPALVVRAIRDRRPSLLDMAWELAIPPLGYLAGAAALVAIVGGLLADEGLLSLWALLPSLIALASIALFVLVGLRAARAPSWAYRALLLAPLFVVRKILRSHAVFRFRPDSWVRTERPD
jgi:1,2-diacylglycerol 3-beta-glucosyltransferase